MDPQNRRILRGAVAAATGKLNISALGLGALSAAAFQSWPLLALGGVAYVALAAWDMSSASFWKRALEAAPERKAGPRLELVVDAEVRAAAERLTAARKSIERALADAPAQLVAYVQSSLGSLDDLEAHAARLVALADGLARHLAQVNPEVLRREAEELDEKARFTKDPESRAHYLEAVKSRNEQRAALGDVGVARERLLANLTRISSSLEGVPTRMLRMRVLDAESVEQGSADVDFELGRINGELLAIEQTLETLVGERSA